MGGFRHLPDAGGLADQPAWTMDALAICGAAAAWVEKHMPEKRGG